MCLTVDLIGTPGKNNYCPSCGGEHRAIPFNPVDPAICCPKTGFIVAWGIPLANNRGVAIVDWVDYLRLVRYKWRAKVDRRTAYVKRNLPRDPVTGKRRQVGMHQMLVSCPPRCVPNHWNFNGLDNRRSNLAAVTDTFNLQYRQRRRGRWIGVTKRTDRKSHLWQARTRVANRRLCLGSTSTAEYAAHLYDIAILILWGGYMPRPNFPYEDYNAPKWENEFTDIKPKLARHMKEPEHGKEESRCAG